MKSSWNMSNDDTSSNVYIRRNVAKPKPVCTRVIVEIVGTILALLTSVFAAHLYLTVSKDSEQVEVISEDAEQQSDAQKINDQIMQAVLLNELLSDE